MATCTQCGNDYAMLGQHWARSTDCHHPEPTEYQKEVLTGMMMSDGSIHHGSKNPLIQICMITPEYLEYVDDILGNLSTGVNKENRTTNAGNEIYRMNTRANPHLFEYSDWYSSGNKVWPSDIHLTPTVLKHLYCGDGNLDTHGNSFRIRIGMSNERENKDKVEDMFSDIGFVVSNWTESERKIGGIRCAAVFSNGDTERMLDYMGDPLPGFGYKWGEKK